MVRLGLAEDHLAITPMDPAGLCSRVQFLGSPCTWAAQTGLPIVPIGFGWQKGLCMKSWDRFAVPVPFKAVSRVTTQASTLRKRPTATNWNLPVRNVQEATAPVDGNGSADVREAEDSRTNRSNGMRREAPQPPQAGDCRAGSVSDGDSPPSLTLPARQSPASGAGGGVVCMTH